MRVLLFTILFFPIYLFGQHKITGKVIDGKTKEALAFVNIVINNERVGTTTSIDGNFSLNSPKPLTTLKLSYVGYEPLEVTINGQENILLKMKRTSFALEEFKVLPGINPAERIIQEVIDNRKKHNPEKSLNFKYESYSKMYFTALVDSSDLNNPEKITKLDSNDKEAMDWLEDHHIFMMESITERKYKQPDRSYEKVIASRVSGLQNATFSLIATEIQSFSFYNPSLKVLDKAYLNPITANGINKYLFLIEDTAFSGVDTVFIISFRPRKGKNFDALKGFLYVNTDGFALQNVIAVPMAQDEDLDIKIQQKYEKIEGSWFPIQLNSTLIFNSMELGNFKMMGIGKTYLKNIEINPEIANKEFSNVATEIDINATKKDEVFWNKYRGDTLSQKEQNTYHVIDSLGKAENLDKMVGGLEALLTGQIMWGPISLDLNRFIAFNEYEGFRLGAGLHTNQRVSKWFTIGGYGAYGFSDKEFKYGGDVDFLVHKKNDVSLNFSYQNDVAEPGVTQFYDFKIPLFSGAGNRIFYLSRMNKVEKIEARFKFRTFRYLKVYLFGNHETVEVTNDYFFKKRIDANTILRDQFYTFNEVGVQFRYAYKEKVIKTLSGKYAKPSNYPVIYAKIEQGITAFDGEYQYTRYAARAEKKFHINNLGKPSFSIEAGLIDGRVPQHKLNSSMGTFKPNKFMIASENAFETMLPYEFFSSEYINFHFRHNFGALLLKIKKFQPEFSITSSIGFGGLSYQGFHGGESFNTIEKGYYESGLIISKLINKLLGFNLSNFGVGAFYRYGPYKLPKTSDNLAVKLNFGITF